MSSSLNDKKPEGVKAAKPRSRKKRLALFAYYVVLAALFFAAGEAGVRLKGYKPWAKPNLTPENRIAYIQSDDTLGYKLVPGEFTITYPNTSASFHVSHGSDGLRRTHPPSADTSDKKQIWIFGCSFTHGYSLNDAETYAWLLQERFPDYEVVNFGVDGYGTVQSLIQFKEALAKRKQPELVIIAYGSFHDERNAALRSWTKWNQIGVLPYARLGWDGKLKYLKEPVVFREFPFMRYSAFMHFLEKSYDRWEGTMRQSHEISKAVIDEFSGLCKEKGIKFIVAGLFADKATNDMLEHCSRQGIKASSISVDLNVPENMSLPYDRHPSAKANKLYAEKLEPTLAKVLNEAPPN